MPLRMILKGTLVTLAVAALGAAAQEIQKRGKTSYLQVDQTEPFASIFNRMTSEKAAIERRHESLLEQRYDLSNRPAKGATTLAATQPSYEEVHVFALPKLAYPIDGLAPHLSAETLEYHYGKHHQSYVDHVNELVAGKPEAGKTLEQIILGAQAGSPLFNNAAQAWNHSFYWNCMLADGGGTPRGPLLDAVLRDFGSMEQLRAQLATAAIGHFGSGWAWLVAKDRKLAVRTTHDADLPLYHGQTALLTIDVWEHAYYIDFRNARAKYIEAFLDHLANWEFAEQNYVGDATLARAS
jgi:superoxide dismutase, Fe-Mn family